MTYKNQEIYKFLGNKIGVHFKVSEIPKEITATPQWLLWKEVNGKKIPHSLVNGKLKAVNARDSSYYLKFDDAVLFTKSFYGLMFVLENTNFWCLDFDDFDNAEEILKIVENAKSYAEITPSGRGFRIWFKGENPFSNKDKSFKLSDGRLIEVFNNKQVTVTGYRISEEKEIKEVNDDFISFMNNNYLGINKNIEDNLQDVETLNNPSKKIIKELIKRYNGKVFKGYITLSCPLHPPDNNPSSTLYLNDGNIDNINFVCHHENITYSLRDLLTKINLLHLLYEDENEIEKNEKKGDWKEVTHYKKVKVRILKELFSHQNKKIFIYLCSISNSDIPFFLKSDEPLRVGDKYLVIKKSFFLSKLIDELEKGRIIYLFKKIDAEFIKTLNITLKSINPNEYNVYEKLDEYKGLEQSSEVPFFYESLNPAEIDTYLPENEENIKELMEYGWFRGAKYDNNIALIFRSFLIKIKQEHYYLARYAPHAIIVTNSKVGKSTLAKIIAGRSFEANNVTSKSLVGFGTSDGVKEGALNFTDECIFYDEVNTLENEELTSGLLNLMELGTSDISKGLADFTTFHGNAHVFLSNKKLIKENESLELAFLRLLLNIHKNVEGLGSRMGIIFYNSKCETVKTKNLDVNLMEKATLVFECLRKKISEKYVEIVENEKVKDWLEQEFPEEYSKEIMDVYNSQKDFFPEIKTFILSYLQAYRHVRGAALRIALFEPSILYSILHNELDIDELLNTSKVYFDYLCKINKTSFEVLKNTSFADFLKISLDLLNLFNSTNSDSIKILLLSIKIYHDIYKETQIDTSKNESHFVKLYNEKIKDLFQDTRYSYGFSYLQNRISSINNDLLKNLFGFNITKKEGGLLISISDEIKLRTIPLNEITLKSGETLEYFYNLFEKLYGEKIHSKKDSKTILEEKLSALVQKVKNDKTVTKDAAFKEMLNLFSLDDNIDLELLKEYFLKMFENEEQDFDYLVRKFSKIGKIYEYKPGVYRLGWEGE